MAGIYEDQKCSLSELLKRANDEQGATLLIPNLQRPYVWTPSQVIWLVDSLIRGWPFGTLLTWKVSQDDPVRALARPFWKEVNRADDKEGQQISQKNPPSAFQMVLDGQQRVQSVILAFSGDAWGFKLYDQEWHTAISGQRARGRQGSSKHWSIGCLCLHVEALVSAYEALPAPRRIAAMEFTGILAWAVTGGKTAQSPYHKPSNYQNPLPVVGEAETNGAYIRLSRLWGAAPAEGTDAEEAEAIAETLMREHGVDESLLQKAARPVGSLLSRLSWVKETRVTYLEIKEIDPKTHSRESYNDAVVNIFTRLNTAGRTLTREDITFAWLKVGWLAEKTGGLGADKCFSGLSKLLEPEGLIINMEDVVAGVSFVWSVQHNEGSLLSNNDLLKGAAIRPMAEELSNRWNLITGSIQSVCDALNELGYHHNKHYTSLASLHVLWAWQYAADLWAADHYLKEVARDGYEKEIKAAFGEFVDRWMLCSQWAGRWAAGSKDTISGYAKRLAECISQIKSITDPELAARRLREFLALEVQALELDAVQGVNSIQTRRRSVVRIYYTPLWLWHRLDKARWAMSAIPLREGRKKKSSLEVDHCVAHSVWSEMIQSDLPAGTADKDEAYGVINSLGN